MEKVTERIPHSSFSNSSGSVLGLEEVIVTLGKRTDENGEELLEEKFGSLKNFPKKIVQQENRLS
jgi:hypothetical protein